MTNPGGKGIERNPILRRVAALALLLFLAGLLALWAWGMSSPGGTPGSHYNSVAETASRPPKLDQVVDSVSPISNEHILEGVDGKATPGDGAKPAQFNQALPRGLHLSPPVPFSSMHPILAATFVTPSQLVTIDTIGTVSSWGVRDGKLVSSSNVSAIDTAAFAGLATDSRTSVFAVVGSSVYRWDCETLSRESFSLELGGSFATSVVFVPATQHLLIGCANGVLAVWDADSATQQRLVSIPGINEIKRLHVSGDSSIVYVEASPRPGYGASVLLDSSQLKVIAQSKADDDFNYSGFLAKNGRVVIQKSECREFAEFPAAAANAAVPHPEELTAEVMAYAEDVSLGIGVSRSGQIVTVDPDTLLSVNISEVHVSSAGSVALSVAREGGLVAVCDQTNAVRLFRCSRESPPVELQLGDEVDVGVPSSSTDAPIEGEFFVGTQRGMVRKLNLRGAVYGRHLQVCRAPVVSIDHCDRSGVVLCLTRLGLYVCDEGLHRVLYSRSVRVGWAPHVSAIGMADRCALVLDGRNVELWNYVVGRVESSVALGFDPTYVSSGPGDGEIFAAKDRRWSLLGAKGRVLSERASGFGDSFHAILGRDGGLVATNSVGEVICWKVDETGPGENPTILLAADNDDLANMAVYVTRRVLWFQAADAFAMEDRIGVSVVLGGVMIRLPGSSFGTTVAVDFDGARTLNLLGGDGTVASYELK